LDKSLGHNKKAVTLRIVTNQKDAKLKEALIEHLTNTFAVEIRQQ
jgi:phenylpyruvate tautomerase PptA (4-oxalocrotonate tautomerase family)